MDVKGVLTLGELPPKEKQLRNWTCQGGLCDIRYTIHIWDDLIKTLKNGRSYHVKNLSIKNYLGNTLLGTPSATLFEEGDVTVPLDKIKGLVELFDKCRENNLCE